MALFKRTKSLVGLDIGSSAVKAVELKAVGTAFKVVAVGSEPVPPDRIVDGAIIDGGVVSEALKRVFGERVSSIPVSATKASTGHLLGGTGALEAVFTILALHERTAPPTINLDNQDEAIPLDVVTSPRPLGDGPLLAISNSFGFGGHNSVVAFRTVD